MMNFTSWLEYQFCYLLLDARKKAGHADVVGLIAAA